MAMITTAGDIINQLKKTSPHVKGLIRELKTSVNEYRRGVIEDLLKQEFQTALMENVPAGMMIPLASMLARSTVADVMTVGETIVVYFLCHTVKQQNELGYMITSGSMQMVFNKFISSLTCTPTAVYVTSPQDEGWLFDMHNLILKLTGISSVTLKLWGIRTLAFVFDTKVLSDLS